MLRLTVSREPRWLDVIPGVRVQVRPIETATSEAAFADALERIRPLVAAAEDAAKAGTPLSPEGRSGANAAWIQGLQWQFLIEAHARYGIVAWEGLGDDNGEPLPVTPAACAAFAAHPSLGREFYRKYRAELDAVDAEGNASAPSPDGATAGAPITATGATAVPNGPAEAEEIAPPVPPVPAS